MVIGLMWRPVTWYGHSAFLHEYPRRRFSHFLGTRKANEWLHTYWGGINAGAQDRYLKDPAWNAA